MVGSCFDQVLLLIAVKCVVFFYRTALWMCFWNHSRFALDVVMEGRVNARKGSENMLICSAGHSVHTDKTQFRQRRTRREGREVKT